MNDLILYLIDVSACLLISGFMYSILYKKSTQVEFRRAIIIIAIAASIIFPLLELSVSTSGTQILTSLQKIQLRALVINSESSTAISFLQITGYLYFAGVIVFLMSIGFQIYKISTIIRGGHLVRSGNLRFVFTDKSDSFCFFNFIIINSGNSLTEYERQRIIEHERYHSIKLHSLDTCLLSLVRAVLWFHPVAWYFTNEIKMLHEYLADAHMVKKTDSNHYSELLARMTLRASSIPLGNYFNTSHTLNRLKMINTQKQPLSKWKIGISVLVLSSMFFTFSCTDNTMYDTEETEMEDQIQDINKVNGEEVEIPFAQVNAEIYERIGKEIKYPEQARKLGVQGKVFIEFLITENGRIEDAKLLKGIGAGCDKEALNAFNKVTEGLVVDPPVLDGNTVRQKLVLPITFMLD